VSHNNVLQLNWFVSEQEPSPKTEDQVEEDVEVLLHLGADEHGAEMRARLMSASLLSDMESFKV
jgi:Rab3 GTPase-activating protein catalytic subunit